MKCRSLARKRYEIRHARHGSTVVTNEPTDLHLLAHRTDFTIFSGHTTSTDAVGFAISLRYNADVLNIVPGGG
jgi:hypothetical protein